MLRMGKKRNLSVFDAIQELESEDVKAESKRRKRSTNEGLRARAAQSQTKIYNHLVECRILLQRAITAAVEEKSSSDRIRKRCDTLLGSLLDARQQLLLGGDGGGDEKGNGNYHEMVQDASSSSDLDEVLQEEYDVCRERWKEVLNRRHNDLKLHSGLTAKSQFRVMDSSFWQQVESTVEYEKIRKDSGESENSSFDDSKVYQQLLKDFVATSTSSTNVDKRTTRSMKKTSKKQVDRRASKGRKIRYKEIPKLVNFTFPLSRSSNSNLDQDEWFQSLFGGIGSKIKKMS